MSAGFYKLPNVENEPVLAYKAGSKEREMLKATLHALKATTTEIKMYIGGKDIATNTQVDIFAPHDLSQRLGFYHKGDATHVQAAIDAALAAQPAWESMEWQDRVAIFLKAAELFATTYRAKINAATMLGQSKNAFQAEIDAAAELVDFLRFNAAYMTEIYAQQPPKNSPAVWNRMEYRPLEGFVFALTPFNFTSICANLFATPVMLGNVALWKPAETQIYSAAVIVEVFKEAGLPAGVLNMVLADGPLVGNVVFNHPDFAGLHFTGSTGTFQLLWETIGKNIRKYKSYPRIVGETGGKDFVMVHASADPKAVAVALSRGAFEYQGQKCSAASRAYIPTSLWNTIKTYLVEDLASMKMGDVEDFTNFINAVIDERAFNKITKYITDAKEASDVSIVFGGNFDKSKGYFIEPTVLLVEDPLYITMREEIFGPVLTIYVYEDNKFTETLELLDRTAAYALTGAIFAKDRAAIAEASKKLRNAAGNFYINDKPTGAVVGQQPFGGGRASGTNDKAGSLMNLYRWLNARTIKENFISPTDYRYPFMEEA